MFSWMIRKCHELEMNHKVFMILDENRLEVSL